MMYQTLFTGERSANTVYFSLQMSGRLDPIILKEAINIAAEQEKALRTVFSYQDITSVTQRVMNTKTLKFEYYGHAEKMDIPPLSNYILDISESPIVLRLAQYSRHCTLDIVWNHILMDGWSNMLFLQELMAIYIVLYNRGHYTVHNKGCYKDFVDYLEKKEITRKNYSYWKRYLTHTKCVDYPEYQIKKCAYKSFTMNFESLRQTQHQVSVSAFLFAAWALLLHFIYEESEICFGASFSGRNIDLPKIEVIVGLFVNTLPFTYHIEDKTKLFDLLQQTMTDIIEHSAHEHITPLQLKSCMGCQNLKRFYNSIVTIENYPMDLQLPVNTALQGYTIREKAEFPLVLGLIPAQNRTIVQYDSDRYTEQDISNLMQEYWCLVEELVRGKTRYVGQIERVKCISKVFI